jgi:predicted TIM-barrel fold metal-dependent hydrolase
MIIDSHAHVSAPAELWAYKASLLASRGSHGRGRLSASLSDEVIQEAANKKAPGRPFGHIDYIDHLGTDLQMLSPRPYQLMQSEQPGKIVQWFHEEVNNVIHRQCQIWPERFIGVAGLPQVGGEDLARAIAELERTVGELGFKGCLLNPDPFENSGIKAPPMGDRYWYPLYEKLCELDVPAHIHGTGSRQAEREPYTLHFINEETTAVFGFVHSEVFTDFPDLKIIVSHGGGAIPYQIGRFNASSIRSGGERFSDKMKKLYYDTTLYTQDAIELLVKTVGADQCLFGSECPGTGSAVLPETGRPLDDVASYIRAIDWMSEEDKTNILGENAKKVFKLTDL